MYVAKCGVAHIALKPYLTFQPLRVAGPDHLGDEMALSDGQLALGLDTYTQYCNNGVSHRGWRLLIRYYYTSINNNTPEWKKSMSPINCPYRSL